MTVVFFSLPTFSTHPEERSFYELSLSRYDLIYWENHFFIENSDNFFSVKNGFSSTKTQRVFISEIQKRRALLIFKYIYYEPEL